MVLKRLKNEMFEHIWENAFLRTCVIFMFSGNLRTFGNSGCNARNVDYIVWKRDSRPERDLAVSDAGAHLRVMKSI